jgi:hypothetical protein
MRRFGICEVKLRTARRAIGAVKQFISSRRTVVARLDRAIQYAAASRFYR